MFSDAAAVEIALLNAGTDAFFADFVFVTRLLFLGGMPTTGFLITMERDVASVNDSCANV